MVAQEVVALRERIRIPSVTHISMKLNLMTKDDPVTCDCIFIKGRCESAYQICECDAVDSGRPIPNHEHDSHDLCNGKHRVCQYNSKGGKDFCKFYTIEAFSSSDLRYEREIFRIYPRRRMQIS